MAVSRALTLGSVYHHLRDGLGDGGAARISIDFRRRSTTSAAGDAAPVGAALEVRRGFAARLDYREDDLVRAELASLAGAGRPLARLWIALEGGRHLYSLDGFRYGLLVDTPVLLDVTSFEAQLAHVPIRDVTISVAGEPPERRHHLEVAVDPEPFRRVLRCFDGDDDRPGEELEPGPVIRLEAGTDVVFHCSWALRAVEVALGDHGLPEQYTSRTACELTVRLETPGEPGLSPVLVDPALPTLPGLDDVWLLAREPSLSGRS